MMLNMRALMAARAAFRARVPVEQINLPGRPAVRLEPLIHDVIEAYLVDLGFAEDLGPDDSDWTPHAHHGLVGLADRDAWRAFTASQEDPNCHSQRQAVRNAIHAYIEACRRNGAAKVPDEVAPWTSEAWKRAIDPDQLYNLEEWERSLLAPFSVGDLVRSKTSPDRLEVVKAVIWRHPYWRLEFEGHTHGLTWSADGWTLETAFVDREICRPTIVMPRPEVKVSHRGVKIKNWDEFVTLLEHELKSRAARGGVL